jgi:O-antigen/teichoic acid export membrane protein
MKTAIDIFLVVLLLLVAVWVVIFGTGGALLARGSRIAPAMGILIGVALGPFGLIWLYWRRREARLVPPGSSAEVEGPDGQSESRQADEGGFLL